MHLHREPFSLHGRSLQLMRQPSGPVHLEPTWFSLQGGVRCCVQHRACFHAQRFCEIQHRPVDKVLPPSTVLTPSDIRVHENAHWRVAELIGSDVDDEPALLEKDLDPVVAAPTAVGIKRAHLQVTVTTTKARAAAMKTVPQPRCQHSRMKAGAFADGQAVRAALQARFEQPPYLAAERFERGSRLQACSWHGSGGGWCCH